MAHFAKIGINGKVVGVHAVNNSDILNANGQEDEKSCFQDTWGTLTLHRGTYLWAQDPCWGVGGVQ